MNVAETYQSEKRRKVSLDAEGKEGGDRVEGTYWRILSGNIWKVAATSNQSEGSLMVGEKYLLM